MDETAGFDPEDPPEGLERMDETVEGTELTVYEFTLYRGGDPMRSGRCVTTEVDGNTVSTVGIATVDSHKNPMTGPHVGMDTYYSNTFVLAEGDSLELEPKYTMTVHPEDVDGEFLSL